MKLLILFVFAFISMSCDEKLEPYEKEQDNTKRIINEMKQRHYLYWRDSTTDICYAEPYTKYWFLIDNSNEVGFPCTDKVLQKIKEQDQ